MHQEPDEQHPRDGCQGLPEQRLVRFGGHSLSDFHSLDQRRSARDSTTESKGRLSDLSGSCGVDPRKHDDKSTVINKIFHESNQ